MDAVNGVADSGVSGALPSAGTAMAINAAKHSNEIQANMADTFIQVIIAVGELGNKLDIYA